MLGQVMEYLGRTCPKMGKVRTTRQGFACCLSQDELGWDRLWIN